MDARYSRQIALPGFGGAGQQRLAASRVLVIGAGGLGSAVIPSLVAAGVGTVGIVDDDRVELSNLHRQLMHGLADVGRSKVQSAMDSVAALDPETTVIPIEQRITPANALAIFADYDLVVDGSDNFATRYLTDDAATLSGIPVVWGAVSQYGGQAGLSWASRGPTYRDLFPVTGVALSCEIGGVLPTVVATIASIMATEAIKVITGVGTPAVGTVTVYDALGGGFRSISYSRNPDAPPVTQLVDSVALTPSELASRVDDFTLLDVREPWEAEIAALDGSVLIPLGGLEQGLDRLDPRSPIVVYCHHGVRSETAREILEAHGFSARHLAGGIDAWARDLDPAMARY